MALSLIGVAASMAEIFVVCMSMPSSFNRILAKENSEVHFQKYFHSNLFGYLPCFSSAEGVFIQQQLSCGLKHLRSFLKIRGKHFSSAVGIVFIRLIQ